MKAIKKCCGSNGCKKKNCCKSEKKAKDGNHFYPKGPGLVSGGGTVKKITTGRLEDSPSFLLGKENIERMERGKARIRPISKKTCCQQLV